MLQDSHQNYNYLGHGKKDFQVPSLLSCTLEMFTLHVCLSTSLF